MSICQKKQNNEEVIYTKSIYCEIKSFDEIQGIFKGYGLVYGNIDRVNDIIEKGAIDQYINEFNNGTRQIKFLYEHSNESLLSDNLISIESDNIGALIEAKISDDFKNTSGYKTIIEDAQNKQLSFSVGYRVKKCRYDKIRGKAIRVIEDLEPVEFSLVHNPANPEAIVTEFKSADLTDEQVGFEEKTIQYKSYDKEFILKKLKEVKTISQAKEVLRKYKYDLSGKNIEKAIDRVAEIVVQEYKKHQAEKKVDNSDILQEDSNIGEQESRRSIEVVSNHKLDWATIANKLKQNH